MCMFVHAQKTAELKALPLDKEIVAWKVLEYRQHDGKISLHSPHYGCGVAWKPGVRVSDRASVCLEQYEGQRSYPVVEKGIHVCLDIDATKEWLSYDRIVVQVRCRMLNFVATGGGMRYRGVFSLDNASIAQNEAVFTEVTLDENEYNRAVDEASQKHLGW